MTCLWEPDPAFLGDSWNETPIADRQWALTIATSSLQMLTYNRVGTCPVTIRPCPVLRRCGCAWNPHQGTDGNWYNDCGCTRGSAKQCEPLSEVDLPGPVGSIESVKVDGVELDLDSGDFRLDEGHLLVWQGVGPSPFPETQDLNKPDSAVGTWSITYSRSYPVGAEARVAVALLAMEFLKARQPRGKCSLPKGVTNVVRNGVSFSVEAGLFPGGLTSIEPVDAFILKWAPAGAPTRAAVVFDPRRASQPRRTARLPRRAGA